MALLDAPTGGMTVPRARATSGPPSARRGTALLVLASILLAGLAVLAVRADGAGAVRVRGIGLLWWYGGLVAPVALGVGAALAGLGRAGGVAAPVAAGAWSMPALWLAVAALLLDNPALGLWVGLLAVVGPLVAGCLAPRARPGGDAGDAVPAVGRLLVGALIVAGGLSLAGAVAERLVGMRWPGVLAASVVAAWPLLGRDLGRARTPLLVVGMVGLVLPVLALGRVAGAGPLGAWVAVAERRGFEFPAYSRWVSTGRDLGLARGAAPLLFEEEHRITAVTPAAVRVLTQDGLQVTQRAWSLAAGQALTLRPGDELEAAPGPVVRFEAGKRVPGGPPSGAVWAGGGARGLTLLALGVAVLGGGLALAARPPAGAPRAPAGAALGGTLVVALLWAECWALYGALTAPDVFLGGASAGRVAELPARALEGRPAAGVVQAAALVGMLAVFVVSSAGLRERLVPLADAGRRPAALWGGAVVLAALAGLGPAALRADAWTLTLWGLGLAASCLVPAWPAGAREPAAAPRAASVAGLAVFAGLLLLGRLRAPGVADSPLAVVLAQPALAALPVGLAVRWTVRRVRRRI